MKFSKSGILTMSGMLIANSFLLMATSYAKYIDIDPSRAQQEIKTINFIEGEKESTCSLVLFDTSGSMKDCKCLGDNPNGQCTKDKEDRKENGSCNNYKAFPTYSKKRNAAVNGAIKYSENFLKGDSNARIGLILFSSKNSIYYGENSKGQKLSNKNLNKNYFGSPGGDTYLGVGLNKAYDIYFGEDKVEDCTKKIVVIITDGEPTDKNAANSAAKKLKDNGVLIYSLGYEVSSKGESTLSQISEGFFYNADEDNFDDIFKNITENKDDRIIASNHKLKAISKNLILTNSYNSGNSNYIEGNSNSSSILGGISNSIHHSDSSTVVAGKSNSIQLSKNSTILGGQTNSIKNKNNENNVILGGSSNTIKNGKSSIIAGGQSNTINGESSTIIGNNSTIVGKNSLAIGSKTKISTNNSFYRSDNGHTDVLKKDNVFAVVSTKGMAVNTNTPNDNAQLTIDGTLVVTNGKNDTNIECGDGNGNGILKTVRKGNTQEKCFCSCNGTNRKSLYNGVCETLCDTNMKPVCGEKVTLECNAGKYVFSGACNSGKVINTSYYITNDNKVHWTCQTYDGQTQNCIGSKPTNKPTGQGCPNPDNGGGGTCTGPKPETCTISCGEGTEFGLKPKGTYAEGTSSDPNWQINSKITECVNSCGTPAHITCMDGNAQVTYVKCCK